MLMDRRAQRAMVYVMAHAIAHVMVRAIVHVMVESIKMVRGLEDNFGWGNTNKEINLIIILDVRRNNN
jgi:hypothetical protein